MSAGSPPVPEERDGFDPRLASRASGPLREFNRAGVLSAADVHVARRLGALGGESDETVLLAVALAVRGPRIGHVLVDLETIRGTVAIDTEDPVDLAALAWPAPAEWITALAASPLVAREGEGDALTRPLRLRGARLYLDRYWSEEIAVADALRAMLDGPAAGVEQPGGVVLLRARRPLDETADERHAAAHPRSCTSRTGSGPKASWGSSGSTPVGPMLRRM